MPDAMLAPARAGSFCEGQACALQSSCNVVAQPAAPSLSHTLAFCETLMKGDGSLWLEDRPDASWTACASLRLLPAEVVGALHRKGAFSTEGWAPVELGEGRNFCAAAPMRPGTGRSFGLLVMRLPPQALAAFDPDVLQAMATVLAHQLQAEEEGCRLRQDRHTAALEARAYRNLMLEAKGRAANEVQKAASLMFLEAMADLPGGTPHRDGETT